MKILPLNPYLCYTIAIILTMLLVGEMDFKDAVDQTTHYCQMVEEGAWPDYRENADEVCQ